MDFFDGLNIPLFHSEPGHHSIFRHEPLYYGLQYNHAGSFFLRINHGPELRAEGPCAFITHPGAFFEYGYYEDTPRHHNHICTCGERVQRYLDSGLLVINDAAPIIRVKQPDRFLNIMLEIMSLLERHSPTVPPRAVLLFEDLLLHLNHESVQGEDAIPAHHYDFFKKLISDVRENPQADWCFEKISRKHGQTFRHFRRLFKSLTGLPPQQFLLQLRLQLAASMLIKNADPVSEIAERAGFHNNIYFYRLFKQHFKITPLEYRHEFFRGKYH